MWRVDNYRQISYNDIIPRFIGVVEVFCPNCGTQCAEGTRFCPSCGSSFLSDNTMQQYTAPQQYTAQSVVEQRAAIRQGESAELEKMIQYFSQKSAQYDEYDFVCQRIDPRYLKKKTGLLVWGIILASIGFLVLIATSANSSASVIAALMFMLGGGSMITGYILSSNAREKNYAKYYQRFDELTNELYRHYQNYGYCLVSAEYTNPSNLIAILQTIQSGRADTIKEAVNILVEDAHRNNMEAFARQTAVSSAAAARGANAAAVFSAANFFFR